MYTFQFSSHSIICLGKRVVKCGSIAPGAAQIWMAFTKVSIKNKILLSFNNIIKALHCCYFLPDKHLLGKLGGIFFTLLLLYYCPE